MSNQDQGLENLCSRCGKVAQELLLVLEEMRAKSSRDKWRTFRQALVAVWQEDRIGQLQKRLLQLRQQIEAHITISLREELTSLRNDHSVASTRLLNSFEATQQINQKLLEHLNHNTQKLLERSHRHEPPEAGAIAAIETIQKYGIQADHGIGGIQKNFYWKCSERFRADLFQLLKWTEMENRRESIATAHPETFQWIFSSDEIHADSNFTNWLQTDDKLYWITGKPGSGKSTLMKFISRNDRTKELLETWAAGEELFVSSYYFWNSGVHMQMTQEGLLQWLLYDALQRMPHMIQKTFPTGLEIFEFSESSVTVKNQLSWAELVRAFKLFVEEVTKTSKVFLLIDELDEFNGDPKHLIEFLHSLLGPNVKMCVSSRPWNVFQDTFATCPSLMLQDLTFADIKHYVSSRLSANPGFQAQQELHSDKTQQLITNVTVKAAGVFLWVVLVTLSLLEGLTDGERLSELQQRLDALPIELESLFWKIMPPVGSRKLEQASRLLQIHRKVEIPLTLIALSYADEDEENLEDVLRMSMSPDDDELQKLNARAEVVRRRLNASCQGLLEPASRPYGTSPLPLAYHHVQYLHRTVREWFEHKETWKIVLDATPRTGFDLYLRLCASRFADASSNNGAFWHDTIYIINCLHNSNVSSDPDREHRWLNGIERVAKVKISSSQMGWSWTIVPMNTSRYISFLHLAVKLQLIPYVRTTVLEGQASTSKPSPDLLFQLLELATLDFTAPTEWKEYRFAFLQHTEPNLELIDFLLQHGADANRCLSYNKTLWELALESHQKRPAVLKVFILHGAQLKKSDIAILRTLNMDAETTQVLQEKLEELGNEPEPVPEVKKSSRERLFHKLSLAHWKTKTPASPSYNSKFG